MESIQHREIEGIPPALYRRLKDTLLECAAFADDQSLDVTFSDARINPWRQSLPQAKNKVQRVEATIDYLYPKTHAVFGENALALFLYVLKDQVHEEDALHQALSDLRVELERLRAQNQPHRQYKKYYIASSMSEAQIREKFHITDTTFQRTLEAAEADFTIFDLSYPPYDWLKYVGGESPLLPMTIFVELEGVMALSQKSILDLIENCYQFKPQVWSRPQDLSAALQTVEYIRKAAQQIAEASRRMAIAGQKASY
jgi:hypothetical protein